nr:hypothetical protein [Tanacetum cinerariifolium]
MACKFVQLKLEEKQLEEERAAKVQNWKLPVCYDDDDDEERSNSLDDNIISGLPPFSTITPTEQSDEVIKSSVEDLIPISSEPGEASPPDSELVSSEVMEIVIPKVGGIEASNDNHIPFYDLIISGTPLNLTPSG